MSSASLLITHPSPSPSTLAPVRIPLTLNLRRDDPHRPPTCRPGERPCARDPACAVLEPLAPSQPLRPRGPRRRLHPAGAQRAAAMPSHSFGRIPLPSHSFGRIPLPYPSFPPLLIPSHPSCFLPIPPEPSDSRRCPTPRTRRPRRPPPRQSTATMLTRSSATLPSAARAACYQLCCPHGSGPPRARSPSWATTRPRARLPRGCAPSWASHRGRAPRAARGARRACTASGPLASTAVTRSTPPTWAQRLWPPPAAAAASRPICLRCAPPSPPPARDRCSRWLPSCKAAGRRAAPAAPASSRAQAPYRVVSRAGSPTPSTRRGCSPPRGSGCNGCARRARDGAARVPRSLIRRAGLAPSPQSRLDRSLIHRSALPLSSPSPPLAPISLTDVPRLPLSPPPSRSQACPAFFAARGEAKGHLEWLHRRRGLYETDSKGKAKPRDR